MLHRLIMIAAWASVVVITFATLARVGVVYSVYEAVAPLVNQPSISSYVHCEHVLAFATVGLLFSLAYPRSIFLVCSFVFGTVALLEALQTMTPDRHGTLADAIEKMAGGAIGILAAHGIVWYAAKRRF
jgi:VanZ family protein